MIKQTTCLLFVLGLILPMVTGCQSGPKPSAAAKSVTIVTTTVPEPTPAPAAQEAYRRSVEAEKLKAAGNK